MVLVATSENPKSKKRIKELKRKTFLLFEENEIFTKKICFYLLITIILIFVATLFTFIGTVASDDSNTCYINIILAFLSIIGIVPSNDESALYMISSLIQSEAAILAIVITLSLVAVQETASRYSPRVTDIFKNVNRNPYFWILISFYLGSMIYGLFTLKQIQSPNLHQPYLFDNYLFRTFFNTLFNIQTSIWLTCLLGILALILLIPYTISILRLLNPSKMMEILSSSITQEQFKQAANCKEAKDYDDNDPIHSIIDIISSSLINYDSQTAITGLDLIGERTKNIFKVNVFDDNYFKIIYVSVVDHFTSVGKLSVKKDNEDFAIKLLPYLYNIANLATQQKIEFVTIKTVDSICQIGKLSIENKMVNVALKSLNLINSIGKTAADQKTKLLSPSVWELEKIKYIVPKTAEVIEEIKIAATENNVNIVKKEAERFEKEFFDKLDLNYENKEKYADRDELWDYYKWVLRANILYRSHEFEEFLEFKEFDNYNTSRWDELNESLLSINRAQEINSEDINGWILKGQVLFKQGRNYEALNAYNEAIGIDPGNIVACVLSGDTHFKLEQYDKALNAYNRALEIDEDDCFVLYNVSSSLFKLGKYSDALDSCNKALEIERNDIKTLNLRDLILNQENRIHQILPEPKR